MADMPAGRELDALVAERVMGMKRLEGAAATGRRHYGESEENQLVWVDDAEERVYCRHCGNMPEFSTDIAAAWLVVERMMGMGYHVAIWSPGEATDGRAYHKFERWVVVVQKGAMEAAALVENEAEANADTTAHAICLAALKAVGEEATNRA